MYPSLYDANFQFRIGYMHAFWTINVFPFYQDVEKLADQQVDRVESSGDSTNSEVESHPLLEKFSKKEAKKSVKKKGRKGTWKETLVNDLVDIILENDTYRTKLLLTNAKNGIYYDQVVNEMKEKYKTKEEDFSLDISQTWKEFKRCINICREAAMKIKTKPGIQRFQKEKNYGFWFGNLMPFVSSMHGCQPQQAI